MKFIESYISKRVLNNLIIITKKQISTHKIWIQN
jgi:hypothetical protein